MSTTKRLLSPQEYLIQVRAADFRSEFYRGEVFAMAGASWEHTLIKDNLASEARNQLKDGPCRVLTSDLRVKVNATGLRHSFTTTLRWLNFSEMRTRGTDGHAERRVGV